MLHDPLNDPGPTISGAVPPVRRWGEGGRGSPGGELLVIGQFAVAAGVELVRLLAVERLADDVGVAGVLGGLGTRLGSGCTSGHGVCGLSRLSPRSLVATLVFMAAGFATVFFVRHLFA